jgi:hypothetical protein
MKYQTGVLLVIAFLALLGSGCGKPPREVDPRLKPYVTYLEKEASARNVQLDDADIALELKTDEEIGKGTQASCGSDPAKKDWNKKVMYIRQKFWDVANAGDKEALVLHELGHCLVGRDNHRDGWEMQGGTYWRPLSLMRSTNVGGKMLDLHREYYINELLTYGNEQRVYVTPGS